MRTQGWSAASALPRPSIKEDQNNAKYFNRYGCFDRRRWACAMNVAKMVGQAIRGLEKITWEIRPGRSNLLKLMNRVAPQFILSRLSKPVDAMLSQVALR